MDVSDIAAANGSAVNSAAGEATAPPVIDIPEGARPELCLTFFNALKDMSEKQNAKAMLGKR